MIWPKPPNLWSGSRYLHRDKPQRGSYETLLRHRRKYILDPNAWGFAAASIPVQAGRIAVEIQFDYLLEKVSNKSKHRSIRSRASDLDHFAHPTRSILQHCFEDQGGTFQEWGCSFTHFEYPVILIVKGFRFANQLVALEFPFCFS